PRVLQILLEIGAATERGGSEIFQGTASLFEPFGSLGFVPVGENRFSGSAGIHGDAHADFAADLQGVRAPELFEDENFSVGFDRELDGFSRVVAKLPESFVRAEGEATFADAG